MKKIFLAFTIFVVFLCSCYNGYDIHVYDTSGEFPYIEDTSGTAYVASVNGKTYHLRDCYIVDNMNEENVRVFYDKDFFVKRGMSPCKKCKP